MYLSNTGTVDVVAQLTRKGRQILAENSAAFNITQFRFSDDEINYVFFDGSTIDALNTELSNWPVLEGCTNGEYGAGQRYSIFTANNNLVNLAELDTDIGYNRVAMNDRNALLKTLYAAVPGSSIFYYQTQAGQAGNFGGAPFVVGQQENRVPRTSAEVYIDYDSAHAGQEYSFIVKTLFGNDNNYLVSFGQDSTVFTVNGSWQSIFPSMADVDPTTTFQNQTQARIIFKLNGDFFSTPNGSVLAPDGTSNPWAIANMSIVGQQTGQRFNITILLWSRSFVIAEASPTPPIIITPPIINPPIIVVPPDDELPPVTPPVTPPIVTPPKVTIWEYFNECSNSWQLQVPIPEQKCWKQQRRRIQGGNDNI